MLRKFGLGILFVAAVAAPVALRAVKAATQPVPAPAKAAGNAFVPVCKAAEVVDTRPDPAWVGASFGNDHCRAPELPPLIDGYSASLQQIHTGQAATARYKVEAGAYQKCISDFMAGQRTVASKSEKPVNAALILIETHRITTSVQNEKKADQRIAVAIDAFNEYGSECVD